MNPRVSRSSALASKATGFPIAKMAAKLAVGYALEEIPNDITRATPGLLRADDRLRGDQDPALRLREVPRRRGRLSTHMQSVGEVMAIGRTFRESFAKAMRSRELDSRPELPGRRRGAARARSRPPAPSASTWSSRPSAAASRSRRSHERCLVDRWFLRELRGAGDRGRRHRGPRPHLQVGRHLRRRVRGGDALLLLGPRAAAARRHRRLGGPPRRARLGRHPRRRPQPDRPGDRVRLLLRARGDDRPRARPRRGDGQLQPGDGLDRLRHLRPPLLRAADGRGRARGLRAGAAPRA